MKYIYLFSLLVLTAHSVAAQILSVEKFENPPIEARPSTYWMWMNGNISRGGITADLEYMKRVGYGGAMMFNAGVGIARGAVDYGSPEWTELTVHAVREAARLGLELYIQNSPGYSGTGGRWIAPEYSMQQLVWSQTIAPSQGAGIDVPMPRPFAKHGFYRDAMVLAYPSPEAETDDFRSVVSRVSCGRDELSKTLFSDFDLHTQHRLEKGRFLVFELNKPFAASSVTLYRGERETPLDPHDGPRDYAPVLRLEVSSDGVNYREVATLQSVALREADAPSIATFPPAEGRFFRFSSNRGTNISEVELHQTARLENWIAKANCISANVSLDYKQQRVGAHDCIDPRSVIDITDKMDAGGRLRWRDAPRGRWTIVRIGHTTTGEIQAAAPTDAAGLECDKFNSRSVDVHFDAFLDPLFTKLDTLCGTTLRALMMDSWEAGKQNWTERFPEYFRTMRGYDLRPFVLAMTGRIVGDAERSERFLWDVRRTHTELFNSQFLARFKQRAARFNLKFAAEPYGDGNFESLEYASYADLPMSEFWVHYIYGGVMTTKLAASSAHTYGRKIVGAECFTGTPFNSKHTEHPYALKALGDWMMTLGVNRFVYHVYAHQPYTGTTPGTLMTMGPFGTHLHRNSPWAEQAAGWNTYNARCAYMLQQGLAVADILFLKEESVSSGITDYDVVQPIVPQGYKWDVADKRVLNERVAVRDGMIVLPDGMSYRIMVVPPLYRATPELLERLSVLVDQGMKLVMSDRPVSAPGLDDSQRERVRALGEQLWQVSSHSLVEALRVYDVTPDVTFAAANRDARLHFTHRRMSDDSMEIYFISNHLRRAERFTASFRVSGMTPTLWNAETGESSSAAEHTFRDGRTLVNLTLPESGSAFIVFRKDAFCNFSDFEFVPVVAPAPKELPSENFTIELWVKPETFAASGRGFVIYPAFEGGDKPKDSCAVGLSVGVNRVTVHERSAAGITTVAEYNGSVEGWTHVAVCYSDSAPALYLNGRKVAVGQKSTFTPTPSIGVTPSEEVYIGSFEGDNTEPVVHSSVLDPAVIADHALAGLPVPELGDNRRVIKTLTGNWQLSFPAWSGAPERVVLPELKSLRHHTDFSVKHFGGTLTYTHTFELSAQELSGGNMVLDMGRVENIASVTINGHKTGLLWKAPYTVNVSGLLRQGTNVLELEVTTLYTNRIIGDEYLPDEHEYDNYGRIESLPGWFSRSEPDTSRRRVLFLPWKYYTTQSPLFETGLLGPVRLINEKH